MFTQNEPSYISLSTLDEPFWVEGGNASLAVRSGSTVPWWHTDTNAIRCYQNVKRMIILTRINQSNRIPYYDTPWSNQFHTDACHSAAWLK